MHPNVSKVPANDEEEEEPAYYVADYCLCDTCYLMHYMPINKLVNYSSRRVCRVICLMKSSYGIRIQG